MKLAGLEWQKHQKLISAHFTFDQFSGTTLPDSSGNGNNGQLHGVPKWIEVGSFQIDFVKSKYEGFACDDFKSDEYYQHTCKGV